MLKNENYKLKKELDERKLKAEEKQDERKLKAKS